MSTGHLFSGSDEIERPWVDELIKELEAQVTVNTKFEIPYCGGSSTHWHVGDRCVYIDKDVPLEYTQKNGKKVDVRRYIVIHETIEHALMIPKELGGLGLEYYPAHSCATAIETDAVEADGYNLDEYTAFWSKWEKSETDEKEWYGVPPDLFMEPYIQSKDRKTMKNMHISVLDRIRQRAKARQAAGLAW